MALACYVLTCSVPSYPVSALLNVTSLYHDSLLARIIKTDPKYKPVLPATSHTRYTRAWSEKDGRYKWAARFLEVLKFVELLIEMGLRKFVSDKARWRGVLFLESIKCVLGYSWFQVYLTYECSKGRPPATDTTHHTTTSAQHACPRTRL